MAIQIINGLAVETDPNANPQNIQTDSMGRKWVVNAQGMRIAEFKPAAAPISAPMPPAMSGIVPSVSAPQTISLDPLLSPSNILSQSQAAIDAAKAPLDPSKFIPPGATELLTKQVNDQLNINRSNAQSDFLNRGLTGSSTEVGTLTKTLPDQANQALAEGTVKLLTAAYPIAASEKAAIVDSMFKSVSLSTQLRGILGDEAFKTMSLQQQREVANQDAQLKIQLADIEMRFQAAIKNAEFAFTAAENDKDRAIQQQQLDYLKSERSKARQGAFLSSLTSLVGFGIGLAMAPATGGASTLLTYGAIGGAAGKEAGNSFSNFFLLD